MPIEKKSLSLEEARKIIDAMLEHYAVTKPGGKAGSHAVVDNAGILLCFVKEDGAAPMTRDVAENKAYTAIMWKKDTRWLRKFLTEGQRDVVWYGGGLNKYAIIPGGVPIVTEDGTVVGAVGSSGRSADEDEEVGLVGIKAAGFKPFLE